VIARRSYPARVVAAAMASLMSAVSGISGISAVAALAGFAALAGVGACGGDRTAAPGASAGSGSAAAALVPAGDVPDGLALRLSDGQQGAPAFDRAKLAPARKLSSADVAALLQRARPIAVDAQDVKAVALRAKSLPPPRTGQTIQSSFPPPPSTQRPPPGATAGSELRVVRYMPEGSVPLAPELSVTFSQPMVAITSHDDASQIVPVKLTPQPPGRWRWIGTRTIVFDPDVRFPQATTYAVDIPAGTKSATGAALGQAVRFSFETAAPTMVSHHPVGSPQRLDVPMFVLFDQKIDPQAVLAKIAVKAGGSARPVRLLDAAEIAKHRELASIVEGVKQAEQDGRWLAFRTTQALPPDTAIDVEIAAGTPSAEGQNTTRQPQRFQFSTYPPLRIARAQCGWGGECPPGMPFQIELNNPLDPDRFDEGQLAITPAIPGVKITQMGSVVSVIGATVARTRYQVVVRGGAGGIVDEFGQTLDKDATLPWPVGDAVPSLMGPEGIVVLDPGANQPTYDVFSTSYEGLRVRLHAVTPRDYDAYAAAMRNRWNHDRPPSFPGRQVLDKVIAVGGDRNKLAEIHIDLKPALGASGLGHAIAVVEPSPWTDKANPPPRLIAWLQSTRLGIDAHVDSEEMVAHATQLDTGKGAAGVALEIQPYGITGTTDERGMAKLALGAAGRKGTHLLVARRGDDVAFVVEDPGYWTENGSWFRQPRGKQLAWYVVDDRQIYKPGEEVSLKGWLRTIDQGKNGDVGGLAGAVTTIAYRVTDATGNQIATGTAPVNPAGGFDTRFTLPRTPNLGHATIELEARGTLRGTHGHSIQIQEFRRPEFEVSAQASQGPFLVGGSGDVTVQARYFAGGPLPGAPVQWHVMASPTSFTPPDRDDYVFGQWQPWWGHRPMIDDDGLVFRPPAPPVMHTAATDATGEHVLHLDFLSVKPARPMSVTASAAVTDVNRQSWSASSALIVHPSSLYVGVKTRRPFVDKGAPYEVDVIGVDLDGKAAVGANITVTAARLDWEFKKGRYRTKRVDEQQCAVTAAQTAGRCSFQTPHGGQYELTATIVDPQGRENQTELTFWVAGGEQVPARDVERQQVQLVPDKKDYAPGSTAELLVQAPFYPAEGVLTWRRSGIVRAEKIALDGPTTVVTVPITDAMVPNLSVQIDLIGMAVRTDDHGVPDPKLPRRPAYAVGTIELSVPPRQRTLKVAVTPSAARLGPGERAQLALAVTDAEGKPVAGAEAAVIVVDEAILSLTGHQFADPRDVFYGRRPADVRDVHSQAYVKLADPRAGVKVAGGAMLDSGGAGLSVRAAGGRFAGPAAAPPPAAAKPESMEMDKDKVAGDMVSQGNRGGAAAPIAIRSDFNPLAAFSPAVHTDAAGKATIEVKLPDNLTRYRVVAIAVAGERQFGKGESAVTARLPLMVRPSPPRFLNFGDRFQLPVVVQNQTDAAMTVRLAVRATNAALTDGDGRELSVPANERVEVQFPVAAELAGTARFQIIGAAGAASDAAEVALPVWTPATTEAFATYGVIDDAGAAGTAGSPGSPGSAIKQPVALPGNVLTQIGGLEVTTASTNLQALTDAVLYLVQYPFECAEQRASRILAIAALKDVLAAFRSKDMPSATAMTTRVAADIERLSQMQNGDGGFAFWDRGAPSLPFLSVHVASALGRAQAKGFAVPPALLDRARGYLRDIENHYPSFYPRDVRWAISAYALYTRKQLGDLDVAKARKLVAEAGVDKLSLEASGWLLGTLAQNPAAAAERTAIVRHALNRVSETAGAAGFTTGYSDGAHLLLASDRRVDAVMLESLIQEQRDHDLIPKLVTGLLGHRKAGRWLNTQENTFALLALDRYFQTYERTAPDFVARVWLGNDHAGEHAFRGRSTQSHAIAIAMADVARPGRSELTIQKDGTGRLYYRIGMTYAPASLALSPADHGFAVERRYEAVDDPKDVTRAADGTWRIKAGARVRVRLTLVNESRRYHVALVDPLPAGLETMNPALAVTGPIPADPSEQKARGAYWWWYGPWYEHQNLRDERVEAFASLLWEGVHKYDYVARATTPGSFVVPPPRAEEMYMPETFGRGSSDRVVIE
jgi:alpha-2-macroglobulin